MTDPTKSTAAVAEESVHPSNTDAKQSDDMGSEGGPDISGEEDRRELAEEEIAAQLGDVA